MELKINRKNQYKALDIALFQLILILLTIVAVSLQYYFSGDYRLFFVTSIGMCLLALISVLPALYLHFQYYQANKDRVYYLAPGCIVIRGGGYEKTYRKEDMEWIRLYLPAGVYTEGGSRELGWVTYHFARIRMKSGEDVLLTNLLIPRVEDAIKRMGMKYEKKFATFAKIKSGGEKH